MSENFLARLIEHNNWANLQILDACQSLNDEQLDFQPQAAVLGTIRETLHHLVTSQEDYVSLLTTSDHPPERDPNLTLAELRDLLIESDRVLIAVVTDPAHKLLGSQLQFSDGYRAEPWVVLTQIINHATEHREQIKSILTALEIEPPRIDGWMYGRESNALIPPSS